jgi:hypothetical protein
MKNLTLMAFVLMGAPAHADEQKLNGAEITAALNDRVLNGSGDVTQIFQKSGATFYSENGAQSQGFWKVSGDSYCSQWPPNQAWPCFDVLRDGDKFTFVSRTGTRYEMHVPKH